MENQTTWEYLKQLFTEEYLYWIQGIEIGTRMEKRMNRFQRKFERMMKRRGITLIVTMHKDQKGVSLSFVPDKEFTEQKKMVDDMLKAEGDVISSVSQDNG